MQRGHIILAAFLDHEIVKHIEDVRERNPKRDVVFKIVVDVVYVYSNIVISHLHEVRVGELPEPMRGFLKSTKVGSKGKEPWSIIVYRHDPEFATGTSNMWVLSANGSPVILNLKAMSQEVQHLIHYSAWIHDYLPKMSKRVFVIEVPVVAVKPEYEHLVRAVEDLELAFKQYREGKYEAAILSLRNIIMNHLLTKVKEVEKDGRKFKERHLDSKIRNLALANVPDVYKDEYKVVITSVEGVLRRILQDHLSKFVHLDTGKLLRMPLREDVEYLLMIVSSLLKYLVALSMTQKV